MRKNYKTGFGYENLEVWDKSVNFAVLVIDTVENISTGREHYRLIEQIEACVTSIAMNTCPIK
jgi:four helix bundle protein